MYVYILFSFFFQLSACPFPSSQLVRAPCTLDVENSPCAPVGPDVPAPPLVGDEASVSAGIALRWKHQRSEVWSQAKPSQTKPNQTKRTLHPVPVTFISA